MKKSRYLILLKQKIRSGVPIRAQPGASKYGVRKNGESVNAQVGEQIESAMKEKLYRYLLVRAY